MMTSIAVQEIHDTLRAPQTDWEAMWRQRGVRLMKLADELEEVTRQRDMLARRCAEQANHIAGLISPQAEEAAEVDPIHDAVSAMQRNGQAL